MWLACRCQADLRGRDVTASGGAGIGGDRSSSRPLYDHCVRGDAGPCLLPAPQLPTIPVTYQVLPHVDDHERTDANARVRGERGTTVGDSTRREFAVHGVCGRWYLVRLSGKIERGLCSTGRCPCARFGAG